MVLFAMVRGSRVCCSGLLAGVVLNLVVGCPDQWADVLIYSGRLQPPCLRDKCPDRACSCAAIPVLLGVVR